jgi:hypothetical protein
MIVVIISLGWAFVFSNILVAISSCIVFVRFGCRVPTLWAVMMCPKADDIGAAIRLRSPQAQGLTGRSGVPAKRNDASVVIGAGP